MYSGCSKEPTHLDGSLEYPQHMFWLSNKKIDNLTPVYLVAESYMKHLILHVESQISQSNIINPPGALNVGPIRLIETAI